MSFRISCQVGFVGRGSGFYDVIHRCSGTRLQFHHLEIRSRWISVSLKPDKATWEPASVSQSINEILCRCVYVMCECWHTVPQCFFEGQMTTLESHSLLPPITQFLRMELGLFFLGSYLQGPHTFICWVLLPAPGRVPYIYCSLDFLPYAQ